VCREILIFNTFFLWRPFTQHVSHSFSHSNLRCGYLDNQSEYRKSPTHFCWLMPCEWDCAAILLVLRNSIADKFNRRSLGHFTPYRLLTLPKRKHCWNCIFFPKVHLLSFLMIYSLLAFYWNWRAYDFFPEGHPRRWEVTLKLEATLSWICF